MLIPRTLVEQRLHYIPKSSLAYVKNAKVACSTIIKSLWTGIDTARGENTYTGNPHSNLGAPFCRSLEAIVFSGIEEFLQAKLFSVVRNPYVRVLSAYLDKVAPPDRDTEVWHPIAQRFRLNGDSHPAFGEFLEIITTERPSLLDEHFCPQYVNLLHPLVGLDFTGHLEKMDETIAFLTANGTVAQSHTPHRTNAREMIGAYYGPKEIALAQRLYRYDFELYGYSTDPAVLEPIRPATEQRRTPDRLRHFLLAHCAPYEGTRAEELQLLKSDLPEINADYISLDAGLLSLTSILDLGNRAIRGEIADWRYVVRIGQELIKRDLIDQGVQVLQRARFMRHPKG